METNQAYKLKWKPNELSKVPYGHAEKEAQKPRQPQIKPSTIRNRSRDRPTVAKMWPLPSKKNEYGLSAIWAEAVTIQRVE